MPRSVSIQCKLNDREFVISSKAPNTQRAQGAQGAQARNPPLVAYFRHNKRFLVVPPP